TCDVFGSRTCPDRTKHGLTSEASNAENTDKYEHGWTAPDALREFRNQKVIGSKSDSRRSDKYTHNSVYVAALSPRIMALPQLNVPQKGFINLNAVVLSLRDAR